VPLGNIVRSWIGSQGITRLIETPDRLSPSLRNLARSPTHGRAHLTIHPINPRSEVRYAEIGGSNPVAIWYQRTYGTEMVDLVAVRWVNEPNVLISLDDG